MTLLFVYCNSTLEEKKKKKKRKKKNILVTFLFLKHSVFPPSGEEHQLLPRRKRNKWKRQPRLTKTWPPTDSSSSPLGQWQQGQLLSCFFCLRTGAVWLSGISSHFCQVDQILIIVSEFLGNVSCDHVSDAESC